MLEEHAGGGQHRGAVAGDAVKQRDAVPVRVARGEQPSLERHAVTRRDRDRVERSADAASEIPRRRMVSCRNRQPRAMKRALDEERTGDRQQDD